MGKSDFKVLIYSQDGFGLGHLRRNLNICLQVKKRYPEASILIIADSPVAPFFKLPARCDFVKIPTIVKVDMGIWQPDRLPVTYRELLQIRSEIIQNVLLSFRPQVFLVDHMPNGALGELAVPLQKFKRSSPETKIVLGLRDILGAPEVICEHWLKEGAYAATETYYDSVYVYGCSEFYNLADEYKFPEALIAKTRYCGYVCRDSVPREFDEQALTKLFSKNSDWFVMVTGGGGSDASYFMDKFIDAVRLLSPYIPFNAIISTGPFMHPDQYKLLRRRARGLPIFITPMGGDTIRFTRRADLVISMAGYNTVCEVLRLRKNAIIVPRAGPSTEQTTRSRIMSERDLFGTIHPTQLTAENFSELILSRLQNGHHMNEKLMPDLTGAVNVAALLVPESNHKRTQRPPTIGD